MMGLSKSTLSLSALGWALSILGMNAVLRGCEAPLQTAPEEELLQYVFGHDGAARFRVGELVSEVQISMHLESPMENVLSGSVEVNPDTYLYGVNALFEADGEPSLERTFWIRSKISDNTDGLPLWVSDTPDTLVTDTRTITFDLDETIPNGGTITISPIIGEEQRVLFRIEKRLENTPDTQPRAGSAARRASQWLPFGAGSVSAQELGQISTSSLRPLGAEWLSGNTTDIYRTGVQESRQVDAGQSTTLLPLQGTSVTVRGPCRIEIDASPVGEVIGEQGEIEPEVTVIRRGSGNGVITNDAIEVPDGGLWRVDLVVPAGTEPQNISLTTDGAGACVWGEPVLQLDATEASYTILPETRRLTSYRLSEQSENLVVSVASGSRHSVLNVEARSPSRATVTYQILNSEGSILTSGRFVATGELDPFSRQVEPTLGQLNSATKFRLVHPYAATHISFSSDESVDLRFLAELQVEPLQAPMYELPRGWRSANAPWDMAPYISLVPQDLEQLLEQQRLVRFDAVVQPVRRESSRPEGLCESHTISPDEAPLSYSIYEEARGQADEWRQWDRSRIDGQVRLNIPSDGELSVDYRFYDEPPGNVALTCGDVTDHEAVQASAGVFRFEGFEAGWQTCRILNEASFAQSALLLARSEGSSRRWAQRRVYPIFGDDTYSIEVDVPAGGTTLYARLYQPNDGPSERPVVHVEVDNGRPNLQTGLAEYPTTASREVSIVASGRRALLSDAADNGLTPLQGIAVTLGDDLSTGTHRVSFRLNRVGDELHSGGYVRFDSCAGSPVERETNARYWWREVSQ